MSSVYFPAERPTGDERRRLKKAIAAAELLLISPAVLFMIAILLRGARPNAQEPSFTAQQIAFWYTERVWTLWILLIAMPLAALVVGVVALKQTWDADSELQI